MPPDPLSYNMSDVNPHLTRCEPPPYIKAGSAPVTSFLSLDAEMGLFPLVLLLRKVSVEYWRFSSVKPQFELKLISTQDRFTLSYNH